MEPSFETDYIDPATEDWGDKEDADVAVAALAGVPQAVAEMARREAKAKGSAVGTLKRKLNP